MVVRLELTPICIAQSFLQHFAPFELHINIKTLLNTPPYEKYTFSEWWLHEESKYDIQKCVGGRVRMSGLRKSTFLDQIWTFPSCVISPYPQLLLPIYHRIWIPYEIPLQKMYTWTGFELTIEKLRCLKKFVEFFVIFKNIKQIHYWQLNPTSYIFCNAIVEILMQFPFRKCILLIGCGVQWTFYADVKHQRCRNSIK